MAYLFTNEEQQTIQAAINECTAFELDAVTGRYKASESAMVGGAVPLYQTVLDAVKLKLETPEQYDAATLADMNSAKLWLAVAVGANAGTGMHSVFTRTYTQEQYLLRTGNPLPDTVLQFGSN